ncbi:MAG: twin-arginine translocase subunit TatC [Planctomycetota bacterium]|nr:twin-arginine translocase subunit TatC [Planctomycetota bacterium]
MARSRDLFDDTSMTFGEHLEVLRVHVFRAVLGIVIAVSITLFFGDRIFYWLRTPVENAMRASGMEEITIDVPKESFYSYLKSLFAAKETPAPKPIVEDPAALRADQLRILIPKSALLKAVGQPPSTVTDPDDLAEMIITAPEFAQLRKVVNDGNKLTTLRMEEGFMSYMKVCFFAGLLLASPWVFYQLWLFIAAGLYPHERKYVHVYLPMSIVLFILGALSGYFFAFPLMLDFLIGFNKWLGLAFTPRLSEYISMAMLMPLMFGVSFQLPMVMVFLERIGVCTEETYKKNWRIAVLVISIASMVLTTSPDPWSMMLMMLPLLLLYVFGIYLCRFRVGGPASPIR